MCQMFASRKTARQMLAVEPVHRMFVQHLQTLCKRQTEFYAPATRTHLFPVLIAKVY